MNTNLISIDTAVSQSKVTFDKLKYLHLAAGIFFFIQTIAYSAVDVDTSVTPSIGKNEDCDGPICTGTLQYLDAFNPTFIIPLFTALASFDHLVCYAICLRYPNLFKNWIYVVGSNPLRMLEYSVSASFMAWAISILSGVKDVHLWFMIIVGHFVGMLLGWIIEILPSEGNCGRTEFSFILVKKILWNIASVSIFSPWIVMLCYFFRATTSEPPPDFVYAAFLGTLLLFCTFGINSYLHIIGKYDFPTSELIYIILSFTAKTFLAADVFGGLAAAEE